MLARDQASALTQAAFAPNQAAYAPKTITNQADPIGQVLDREAYAPGAGPVRWNVGEVQLSRPSGGGPVDSLRFSVGGALVTPGGGPIDFDRAQFEPHAYEIAVIRDWPGAVSFENGKFDVDVSPHVGVGVGNTGGSAEGGATLRLSKKSRDERATEALRGMGVGDGLSFGNQGRFYLFMAVSGRAVGMNMLRDTGDWDRAGWTTDPTSALIGDGQIGVGWRKGALQSSFGYVHREVKGQHMMFGQKTYEDSMVAFTFSIKPSH
jgi:hypothetical protein